MQIRSINLAGKVRENILQNGESVRERKREREREKERGEKEI